MDVKKLSEKLFPNGFERKSYSEISDIFIKNKNDIKDFIENCEANDKVKNRLNKLVQACDKKDDVKIFHRMNEVASFIEVDNKVRKNKEFIEFAKNLKEANAILKKSAAEEDALNGGLIGFIEAVKCMRIALFRDNKGVTPADWRKVDSKSLKECLENYHNSTHKNRNFIQKGNFKRTNFTNFISGILDLSTGVRLNETKEIMESAFNKIKKSGESLREDFKKLQKNSLDTTDKLLAKSIKLIEQILSYTAESKENWKNINESSKSDGRAYENGSNLIKKIWDNVNVRLKSLSGFIFEVCNEYKRFKNPDEIFVQYQNKLLSIDENFRSIKNDSKGIKTRLDWILDVNSFCRAVSDASTTSENAVEFADKLIPAVKEFRTSIQNNDGLREWEVHLEEIFDGLNDIKKIREQRELEREILE